MIRVTDIKKGENKMNNRRGLLEDTWGRMVSYT